ncbi:hypothetical protein BU16DRAFT_598708 [Lophium mytilinum]|uniref:Transposase IS30-like HTH domain-containing protein n=1 Tax=Lophium mytilinum TaxID=390894 RepID=A0A6A6R8K6_9PEZI|nr:hypothetical protein BU16DRAFT_598708 [Lophium mytilinum]
MPVVVFKQAGLKGTTAKRTLVDSVLVRRGPSQGKRVLGTLRWALGLPRRSTAAEYPVVWGMRARKRIIQQGRSLVGTTPTGVRGDARLPKACFHVSAILNGRLPVPYKMTLSTPQRQLTRDERLRIQTFHEAGLKLREICKRMGVSLSTVSTVINGPTTPTKSKGRRPILDTPTRHRLVLHATLNADQRRKPWRVIANELGI